MTAFLINNIAPLMFAALVVVLLIGYPVAFSLAAVGIGFGILGIHLGLLQETLLQALFAMRNHWSRRLQSGL